MANLETNYLGIKLKNPIMVGASNMVDRIDNLKRAENAGAAAIVYKSLFEEQIRLEQAQLDDELEEYTYRHAEMTTLFPDIEHAGAEEHLHNLSKARKAVNIPLIASLNAVLKESWIEYARKIEETGVDALELNFYAVPKNFDVSGVDIEKHQIEILTAVKDAVSIPVSIKLSPFYSNILHFIAQLDKAGADGIVIFNRFYQPDIDVDQMKHISSHQLSTPFENKLAIRFAGLLYGNIGANICASRGIHSGNDVIKLLLVGADCVQVVSALYQNKIDFISTMINEIESWMKAKGFNTIDDFRGKLSQKHLKDPFVYQRAQYIDLLLHSDQLLNRVSLP